MKVKVITDYLGYVESLIQTGTKEDDVEVNLDDIDFDYLNCYKVVVNQSQQKVLELDEKKKASIIQEKKELEVAQLKQELKDTDYKISKSTEYLFAKFKEVFGIDFDFPYDMELLNQQRQELRDRINELEN